MGILTYTAKRNIEPLDTPFSVTGTDISFDTADDSINSSTTDLSGLSNGDWVKVEGSTSNDGWHQVNASSTATKITVDSDLTTEASGDTVTITGYKRGSGEEYQIENTFWQFAPSHDTRKEESPATFDGTVSVQFYHKARFLDMVSDIVAESEQAQWDEFLDSVAGGEVFQIDLTGTIASPGTDIDVKLIGDPDEQYIGGGLQKQYSFKVRRV